MVDIHAFFCHAALQDNLKLALSMQQQVIGDWQKSSAAWQARRVSDVRAALDLSIALAGATTPQAAAGYWFDWYSRTFARWTDDLQEQMRIGSSAIDKCASANPAARLVAPVLTGEKHAPDRQPSISDRTLNGAGIEWLRERSEAA